MHEFPRANCRSKLARARPDTCWYQVPRSSRCGGSSDSDPGSNSWTFRMLSWVSRSKSARRWASRLSSTLARNSRSCTYTRSRSFVTSLATFGRRPRRSACHCAIDALYSSRHVRVDALRRSSREIVDGLRPNRRATSRTPRPCARRIAISSRSANERKRPDTSGGRHGFTPPAWRNHRNATGDDTPATPAASSVFNPPATAAQNPTRSARHATVGRPGEGTCPRYNCTCRCRSRIVPTRHLPDRGVATTT